MNISSRKEPFILLFGDIVSFVVALWLALFLRYGELPSKTIISDHAAPFAILFLIWLLVFFIAGLYEKQTVMLKSRLPSVIFNAQLANSLIGIVFFYLSPVFGINPKTNLFLCLVFSFILVLAWRLYGDRFFGSNIKQSGIIVGSNPEMNELLNEVNNNNRYSLKFVETVDADKLSEKQIQENILSIVSSGQISVVAVDMHHEKMEPILPSLYNLLFSKVRFVDMYQIYEDIFDRIPLSLIKYSWFFENISLLPRPIYNLVKRVIDLLVAIIIGILTILIWPFVALAIKLDDRGPIMITQDRIGRNNQPFRIYKFRTMSINDSGDDNRKKENKITKVGRFLRRTRIDELPQVWNILKGEMSLIGPRPELPNLASLYSKEIKYYDTRHLITPGLSGWAQLYHKNPPKVNANYDETRNKLSYDLYYIKNQSLMLDLKIALRTIHTLLSRSGV